MRELKFRAWIKNNQLMIYQNSKTDYFMVSNGNGFGVVYDHSEWLKDKEFEITQYTGIKDKNGKEIYEGDIVKCVEVTNDKIIEYVSKVTWVNCCYLVHESENCDCELGMFGEGTEKYPLTEIEVIGNIYENPELLNIKTLDESDESIVHELSEASRTK